MRVSEEKKQLSQTRASTANAGGGRDFGGDEVGVAEPGEKREEGFDEVKYGTREGMSISDERGVVRGVGRLAEDSSAGGHKREVREEWAAQYTIPHRLREKIKGGSSG